MPKKQKKEIKPALLVIDIQNTYLQYIPDADKDAALLRINYYIEMFRQYDCPVINIYHYSKEKGPEQKTQEFEFPSSVPVKPEDTRIIKTYPDSFNKTDLDKVLREKGCNTLFLCGLSSVGCVLATWLGAFNHDYKAFLIKDAIMSHKKSYTENIETMFEAVGHDVIQLILDSS